MCNARKSSSRYPVPGKVPTFNLQRSNASSGEERSPRAISEWDGIRISTPPVGAKRRTNCSFLAGRAGSKNPPPVGAKRRTDGSFLAGRAGFEPAAEVLAPALT